jgi:hypothetical protein
MLMRNWPTTTPGREKGTLSRAMPTFERRAVCENVGTRMRTTGSL